MDDDIRVEIYGYLWCDHCKKLALDLKELDIDYVPFMMEEKENKKYIVSELTDPHTGNVKKEKIRVPIIIIDNDLKSMMMRPSAHDVLKKLGET